MNVKITASDALHQWCEAASSGDIAALAELYLPDATLHPTLDDRLQNTVEGRLKYFEFFLRNGGFQKIVLRDQIVQHINECVFISGCWNFHTFTGEVLKARFTFGYVLRDGKWKIICHHSSLLPPRLS